MRHAKASEWIPLSPSELWFQQEHEGLSVSPNTFDMPNAVRAVYDRTLNSLSIDFNYDSREQNIQSLDIGSFSFLVGMSSGRLYSFAVKLHTTERASMQSDAEKALVEAAKELARLLDLHGEHIGRKGELRPRLNVEMARRTISSQSSRLAKAVC